MPLGSRFGCNFANSGYRHNSVIRLRESTWSFLQAGLGKCIHRKSVRASLETEFCVCAWVSLIVMSVHCGKSTQACRCFYNLWGADPTSETQSDSEGAYEPSQSPQSLKGPSKGEAVHKRKFQMAVEVCIGENAGITKTNGNTSSSQISTRSKSVNKQQATLDISSGTATIEARNADTNRPSQETIKRPYESNSLVTIGLPLLTQKRQKLGLSDEA